MTNAWHDVHIGPEEARKAVEHSASPYRKLFSGLHHPDSRRQ